MFVVKKISLFIIILFFSSPVFAQEEITITTYYPAPFGSYRELTTSGDTHLATESSARVGIGTINPGAKLEVDGDIYITGSLKVDAMKPVVSVLSKNVSTDNHVWKEMHSSLQVDFIVPQSGRVMAILSGVVNQQYDWSDGWFRFRLSSDVTAPCGGIYSGNTYDTSDNIAGIHVFAGLSAGKKVTLYIDWRADEGGPFWEQLNLRCRPGTGPEYMRSIVIPLP